MSNEEIPNYEDLELEKIEYELEQIDENELAKKYYFEQWELEQLVLGM